MCMSPPTQWIRICSFTFKYICLRQNQMLPSGGGASHIHGSTMRRASFAVIVNLFLKNQIQGGVNLQRPAGVFGSLFPFGKSQIERQQQWYLLSFPPKGGYDIVLVDQYWKLHILQEVGSLKFIPWKCAGCPSTPPSLHQNIAIHSVYILDVLHFFKQFACTYGIHCLFIIIFS